MDSEIEEKYKILLEQYGNKFTDFDLFFQSYEGLFVFSRIDIVYNVLNLLLESNIVNTSLKFLETGSGDGRIVALASIIGFPTYGLELSNDMKEKSLEYIEKLKQKDIFVHIPIIKQGDFLKNDSYKKLNCTFQDIDIFFNYYTNTEQLIKKVAEEGKVGSIVISVSLSKRSVKTKMNLIYSTELPDRNHYLFVYKK